MNESQSFCFLQFLRDLDEEIYSVRFEEESIKRKLNQSEYRNYLNFFAIFRTTSNECKMAIIQNVLWNKNGVVWICKPSES